MLDVIKPMQMVEQNNISMSISSETYLESGESSEEEEKSFVIEDRMVS